MRLGRRRVGMEASSSHPKATRAGTAHSHTKAVAARPQGLKRQPKQRRLLSVPLYVKLKVYVTGALG